MTNPTQEGTFDDRSFPILNEEVERTQGEAAQSATISVGIVLGDLIRTTIGPLGMDKMIVDEQGCVIISSAGTTILDEIGLEHPAAEIILEGAKSQRDDVGDGTTTLVLIIGELLDNAADLIEQGIHPRNIINGYHQAAGYALKQLEKQAIRVEPNDTDILSAVAHTAMNGGILIERKGEIADIAVQAVRAVVQEGKADLDYLGTEAIPGEPFTNSRLVDGVVINRDAVHSNMPTRIEDAKIALIDSTLETPEPELATEATVTNPDQLQRFHNQEEQQLYELAERIASTGANMIVTEESIDKKVQNFLAEEGILALRRAKDTDLDHLASATDGQRIANIEELKESHLGTAGLVEQRKIGNKELFFIEACENPESVTLLVRGGTNQVAESTEQVIGNTFKAIALTIETGSIVPGGGATELQLSLGIQEYADGIKGREQLAIHAFAEALEVVPRTLAENSGHNPIDSLVELRSQHSMGQINRGLNANGGEICDAIQEGIVEPTKVKQRMISRCQDITSMLLGIDDVFIHPNEIDRQMPDTESIDDSVTI